MNKDNLNEKIVHTSKGWFLKSKTTGRNLGGPYSSREGAEKREREVKYFASVGKKQKVNETFEMEDIYNFWGWIIPKEYSTQVASTFSKNNLLSVNGQIGVSSAVVFIPSEKQRESFTNYTHSTLSVPIVGGYTPAFNSNWYRVYVEEGSAYTNHLTIIGTYVDKALLKEGIKTIHNICNTEINDSYYEQLADVFGSAFFNAKFTKIRFINKNPKLISLVSDYGSSDLYSYTEQAVMIQAKNYSDLIQQVDNMIVDILNHVPSDLKDKAKAILNKIVY